MTSVHVIRRGASVAMAMLLALAAVTPAHADASDDYAACLIGKAAVALHKQDRKSGGTALEAAYKRCKEPKGISESELEGVGDFANTMVEAMASAL